MNTSFLIDGGAGRVLSSIPALEKYERLNPKDDFKILVRGFEPLFRSHPSLQKRTFEMETRGSFENFIKPNKCVHIEPYHNYNYYNQKISMAEAFDEMINGTEDHSDLNYNCLHLSETEKETAHEYINTLKQQSGLNKVIMFQPFGSTAKVINNKVIDDTNRSLTNENYMQLVSELSKHAIIIYVGEVDKRDPRDNITIPFGNATSIWHRDLIALTYHSDYFLGCDSVGQHVARFFNKQGSVLMGGTDDINCSYPNHFNLHRTRELDYTPMRTQFTDYDFSTRINDGMMNFNDEQISNIISEVKSNIGVINQSNHRY